MRFVPPSGLVVVSLVATVIGSGCGSSAARPSAGSVVKVIAAENFWGDIAGQIGGNHVAVRSIISDPSTDPHQYESDARDAAAVADARLVIVNGVGYDDAVSKLLSNSSSNGRVVLSVADVLQVTGNDANPHLWYDLPRIPDLVVRPGSEDEVTAVMQAALATDAVLIAFGGGSSISGSLEPEAGEERSVVSVDMVRLDRVLSVDAASRTAASSSRCGVRRRTATPRAPSPPVAAGAGRQATSPGLRRRRDPDRARASVPGAGFRRHERGATRHRWVGAR